MYMENGLPGIRTSVRNETVARLINTFTFRQLTCHLKEMSHELFIVAFKHVDRCHMSVRHNQDVGGPYGVDIPEGGRLIVAEDNGPLDFTRNNFTEETRVAHFGFSLKVWLTIFNHKGDNTCTRIA
jgi:hypothetical protein